jgi:hypothetical protein
MADPDPLEELRAQVRATQEAAERLMGDGVPPRGWAAPRTEGAGPFAEEVQALAGLLQALRELLPFDLREQLNDLLRQLLLVLRALLDWWVAHLEPRAAGEAAPGPGADRGEDIPIG